MTVSLGPKRLLGANTLLGTSQFLGQGNTSTAKDIEWEVLFSTDDASVAIPSWTYIQDKLRAFSVSRGRASELSDVDAGTAHLTLDNRDRRFDPLYSSGQFYPNLRPMNRVWIRLRFNGDTLDVFKGWVERYEQQYPGTVDAVTIVSAVDEFKVLALRNLPTTDPPRETYADVVQFDQPGGYWQMSDDPTSFAERATVGPTLVVDTSVANGMSAVTDGAIVGGNPDPYAALQLASTQYLLADGTDGIDVGGSTAVSAEVWFKTPTLSPTNSASIVRGPGTQWFFSLNIGGQVDFGIKEPTTGTNHLASANISQTDTWIHLVGTFDGSNVRLYINGVLAATTAYSGSIITGVGTDLRVGNSTATATYSYDELAIYRYTLSLARIAAHYVAGTSRGFARSQLAGQRIGGVLDSISSQIPRRLLTGTRQLAGQYAGNGRHSLELLAEVKQAEAVDAVLFIARDGTITFLDGGYRSTSPWDTVQATFGDAGGSELDFMDIQLDYSDSFIANEWNVTRENGTTQTSSDTTSQTRYLKRPQSLTDLKLRDDSDALDVSADMLSKYKDPLTRVLSIKPKTMDVNVIDAVFRLELGDRITVKLTPPGGGSRFDQTLFVQSIAVDATPQAVFPTVTLGVSPV